jgi:tRNA U34 5-carboxymethylaminomethyl modifying GTPase MnmE/TrmE
METQAIEQTVNLQMVESIIQLIRSLPIAEQQLLERRLSGELTEYPEVTTQEIMQIAQHGGAFDFLHDEPDIYTLEDGEPIQWP